MLEVGARFTNTLYAKLSLDPDTVDATVSLEIITDEGVLWTHTGTVTWDEDGEDDGDGLH